MVATREFAHSAQLDFAAALIGQELTLELGIVPVRVADYNKHTGDPRPPRRALPQSRQPYSGTNWASPGWRLPSDSP